MNEYDRLYRQAQRYREMYPEGNQTHTILQSSITTYAHFSCETSYTATPA